MLLTVLALMAEVGFALPGDEAHGSDQGHRRGLQTSRPYNIAHRGACGEFPEESAAAYQVGVGVVNFSIRHLRKEFLKSRSAEVAHIIPSLCRELLLKERTSLKLTLLQRKTES